jgi:dienelactone hydrolase
MRADIAFLSEGVTLRGWLSRPEKRTAPVPAVVMAHGVFSTKEMDWASFAEACSGLLFEQTISAQHDELAKYLKP